MRTFAQKPEVTQHTTSGELATRRRALLGRGREVSPFLHAQRTLGSRAARRLLRANREGVEASDTTVAPVRFGGDFSRVPVSAGHRTTVPTGTRLLDKRVASQASGETEGGALDEETKWLPSTGDDEGASAPGGPGDGETTSARRLQKSTVRGPSTKKNGGFSWGARWSVRDVESTTKGWIVQHVVVRQNVKDADGAAVAPGEGDYGGLRTSWYPLWEAWQVRGGKVYVGRGRSSHRADNYSQRPVAENTQGTTEVVGRADFYPDLTLPSSFKVTNKAPAWSLPATTTDPGLTGGTGVLDHDLTAKWDGVDDTGDTNVKTK